MNATWILALVLTAAAGGKKDTDGDGIPDKEDLCKGAAEDMDGFEDADGCPEVDNDRDGVIDEMDACPNEPEDKDGFHDADGCPETEDEAPVTEAAPNMPLKAVTALDEALKSGEAEAAQALFHPAGWAANLMGGESPSGEGLVKQAQEGGWALSPLESSLEEIGERQMVWVKLLKREDSAEVGAVYLVLLPADGGWKLLAAGEDEFAARDLAEKTGEPEAAPAGE